MTSLASAAQTTDPTIRALGAILGATRDKPLRILDRTALDEGTSFGEIVRCRLGRGATIRVFCKHGRGWENAAHGHRGGPGYEAGVYQFLSRHSRCPVPRFRGGRQVGDCWWLATDFLEGGQPVHLTGEPEAALAQAGAWAGQFHAEQEISRHPRVAPGFNRYDRAYYTGWVRRARLFARPVRLRFPWLGDLWKRFEEMFDELLDSPQTLIHGEFYPKNILLYRGNIFPVDWESAAIAPGEIDLATLTEGWTRRATQRCESRYAAARWPDGAPQSFARRLALCRLYVHLRWLGDRPEWTQRNSSRWHFKQLHKAAKQLGALS